jgi:hypothetical protein
MANYITRTELNEWKKQFQVGDKVKITADGKWKDKVGVVFHKTSYVFVSFENGQEIGFRSGLEIVEKFIKPKKEKTTRKLSYTLSRASKLYKDLVSSGVEQYHFSKWLKENDMVVWGEKLDEHSNLSTQKAEYDNGKGDLFEVLKYFMYNWKLTNENYASKQDDGTYYYSTSWSYDGFSHDSVITTKEPLDQLYKKYLAE